MSIDDKINEALGITPNKPATKQVVKKEFTPPVPRLEDKNKEDLENDHKYSRGKLLQSYRKRTRRNTRHT